jgi:hypothetical protein
MIIDDKHEFIFIHIPKCGGSSLRKVLAPFDSTGGFFTGRVAPLGELGLVDHVHIPLSILRDSFPAVFEKLGTYKSFAMMRDPVNRFVSALGQWFKNTKHEQILEATPEQVVAAARSVLKQLQSDPQTLNPDLIHFRPQSDFILLGDSRIVKRLYRIEHVDQLASEIEAYLGVELPEIDRSNQATYFRNNLARVFITTLKPVLVPIWTVLPLRVKVMLFRIILRPAEGSSGNLRGAKLSPTEILEQAGLIEVVRAFYKSDYALLELCEVTVID